MEYMNETTLQAGNIVQIEIAEGLKTTAMIVEQHGKQYFISLLTEKGMVEALPVEILGRLKTEIFEHDFDMERAKYLYGNLLKIEGVYLHQRRWADLCNKFSAHCEMIDIRN